MKTLTTTIARILFAVPFLGLGLMHFAFANAMAGAIPSFLPGGVLWVYLTGTGIIAAAISLISQKFTKEAMIGLSIFLVATISMVQFPGMSNADPMMAQMSTVGFLKDIGLLGAALSYLGQYSK